jgi:RimJ/RimL family protein N-acetyltransferase
MAIEASAFRTERLVVEYWHLADVRRVSAVVADPGGVTVRLGYLIAEGEWGRGLGGELVAGLVVWCRTEPAIRALIGGVAADNTASIRILERSGFKPEKAAPEGDLEYRLNL